MSTGIANPSQGTPNYKFPQAQKVVEMMIGNLGENMVNPDAIENARYARDVARAEGGDSGPQIDPEKADRIDKAKTSFDVRGF